MKEYNIMDKTINEVWDLLIEYGVATQEELELVTCINGYSMDTINSIIYARTGYRNIDQVIEDMEQC